MEIQIANAKTLNANYQPAVQSVPMPGADVQRVSQVIPPHVQRAAPRRHLQIKGDPSIRRFLFEQSRVGNEFDDRIDQVIDIVHNLISSHGVFHVQIHFSSGQVTLWLLDDPYNYRVILKEELFCNHLCRKRAKFSYPDGANVGEESVRPVLERLKTLRLSDETIYLRSGSLNIMNGTVGLNFSCDGTHYLDHQEFLTNENFTGV